MGDEPPKRFSVAFLEFLSTFFWPGIVLFLIWQLLDPLKTSIQFLPDVLKKTKSVQVGSFTIELKGDTPLPPTDIQNVLRRATEDDLRFLLEMAPEGAVSDCDNWTRDEPRKVKLIDLDLLIRSSNAGDRHCPTLTALSPLGKRCREYMISLLFTQIIK